jgi:hypothetical protein
VVKENEGAPGWSIFWGFFFSEKTKSAKNRKMFQTWAEKCPLVSMGG